MSSAPNPINTSDICFVKINQANLLKYSLQNPRHLQALCLVTDLYAEFYQEKFVDLSFLITQNKKILGHVICSIFERNICFPGDGVVINLTLNHPEQNKKLYIQIINYLDELAKQHQCNEMIIKDSLLNSNLSCLGEVLFNHKYTSKLTFEMLIPYTNFSKLTYHQSIRKSYTSYINWGKNNFKLKYINKESCSPEEFQKLQEFHIKTAGRQTCSDEAWNIQYKIIKSGCGEIILAYYKEQLVSGAIFIDHNDTSYYSTGVYERELFQFGMSHYTLYHGICRSYERHTTSKFSLGYFDNDIQDKKWYNIQFFKKGFCSKLAPTIMWSKKS